MPPGRRQLRPSSRMPGRAPPGRGWRPGRSAPGRTRPGRTAPGAPTAGRARCGGSRCPCARSGTPASRGGPGHWPGRGSGWAGGASASPLAWAMSWPQAACQPSQRASSGSASSPRSGDSSTSADERGAGLAERQGRGLQAARPHGAGVRQDVGGRARQEVGIVDLDGLEADLRRARSLERRQGERRADRRRPGDPSAGRSSICRPSSSAPPVTTRSARVGGRDPRHRPVEPIAARPGLHDPDRLGTQPSRGRQVRDPDRRDGVVLARRRASQRSAVGRSGRRQQPAERRLVLGEDEDGRQAAAGEPGIPLDQRGRGQDDPPMLLGERPPRGRRSARASPRALRATRRGRPRGRLPPRVPPSRTRAGLRRDRPRSRPAFPTGRGSSSSDRPGPLAIDSRLEALVRLWMRPTRLPADQDARSASQRRSKPMLWSVTLACSMLSTWMATAARLRGWTSSG